jgi:hypothetical protein
MDRWNAGWNSDYARIDCAYDDPPWEEVEATRHTGADTLVVGVEAGVFPICTILRLDFRVEVYALRRLMGRNRYQSEVGARLNKITTWLVFYNVAKGGAEWLRLRRLPAHIPGRKVVTLGPFAPRSVTDVRLQFGQFWAAADAHSEDVAALKALDISPPRAPMDAHTRARLWVPDLIPAGSAEEQAANRAVITRALTTSACKSNDPDTGECCRLMLEALAREPIAG